MNSDQLRELENKLPVQFQHKKACESDLDLYYLQNDITDIRCELLSLKNKLIIHKENFSVWDKLGIDYCIARCQLDLHILCQIRDTALKAGYNPNYIPRKVKKNE